MVEHRFRQIADRRTYHPVIGVGEECHRNRSCGDAVQEALQRGSDRAGYGPDADKVSDVKLLESTALAPAAKFILHVAALNLAGCILDTDNLVADMLGDERAQRIGSRT